MQVRRYSFAPLLADIRAEEYREIMAQSFFLAEREGTQADYFQNSRNIEEAEKDWRKWKGKLFIGGQSTVWAMRFVHPSTPEPQIIKCFQRSNPFVFVSPIVSSERFLDDFPTPIRVNDQEYLIRPAKNLALIQSEGKNPLFFQIQLFSQGPVIPPTFPIVRICKAISAKGYVIDSYPKNWRLREDQKTQPHVIEYIDQILWNKIYDLQKRIQILISLLNEFQYTF